MTTRDELSRLRLILTLTYLVSVIGLSVGFATAHFQYRRKLATVLTEAARQSLLAGDFELAHDALCPALSNGFTRVLVLDATKQPVLELEPSSVARTARMGRVRYAFSLAAGPGGDDGARVLFVEDIGVSAAALPLLLIFGLFGLFHHLFGRTRARLEERQRVVVALAEARAERDLAARLAHDIRSPLSAITMTLGREGTIGPAERRLLNLAARRILGIAESWLDDAREAEPSAPLATVLREAVALVRAAHRNRDVRFELDLAESFFMGDPTELSRAIVNLLTNAVEADAKTIRVSTRRSAGGTHVTIADDGRGVPAALLDRLGRERVTAGKRGFGLGVWSAADFARRTGGHLDIESAEGRGTTVTLYLKSDAFETRADDVLAGAERKIL